MSKGRAVGAGGGIQGRDTGAYGERLGGIFKLPRAPSFVNRGLQAGLLAVTEIRDDEPEHRVSDPLPVEDAFLATLLVKTFHDSKAWEGGLMSPIRTLPAGETLLRDLKQGPSVLIEQPHHSVHFYIPRAALDFIADDAGAQRIGELRYQPGVPVDDAVVRSLGASVLAAFALAEQANRMFVDHVMMAVATHVAQTYGGLRAGARQARGGLTPWQARRAKELLNANLAGDMDIRELALECGVSVGHFRRAFRQTTSLAPHQWLLRRRVELAKTKLADRRLSLAEIGLACGFADQSHFTRVFSRIAGQSPGRWRRTLEVETP